jgi:hypothetical protein
MKAVFISFLFILSFYLCSSQVNNSVIFTIKGGAPNNDLKRKIEFNTSKFLSKLNEEYKKGSNELSFDEKIITENGKQSVSNLWKNEHFYCVEFKLSDYLLQNNDSFQIRNIPIAFKKDDKQKLDGVLQFLPDGKIDEFRFGLEANQYREILYGTSDAIDQSRREIISYFLENLRTAYVKKDISYIEKLYSDKALIIVGKVIKTVDIPNDSFQKTFTSEQIEYQVKTKAEYLASLQQVFSSISYLRLDFKKIQVIKHRKYKNFYGIRLQQTWESSNYNDDGYLFLLVQFKDNEDPLIWVRTWQDVKDTPAGNEFDLHNFTITEGQKIN